MYKSVTYFELFSLTTEIFNETGESHSNPPSEPFEQPEICMRIFRYLNNVSLKRLFELWFVSNFI